MFREKESEDLILRRQIKSECDFFLLKKCGGAQE
jgi:hypothetical protein